MSCSVVLERVERITQVRADAAAQRAAIEAALRDVAGLRGWLASAEADLVKRLAEQASFPEAPIADTTRVTPTAASKVIERSKTLNEAPDLASSLDAGAITADHVDAVTRAAKDLEPGQRKELIERCDRLSNVAENASPTEWGKRVRDEASKVQRDDGMAKLERQRRATSMSTWVDDDGMFNLRGRFDPVTGVKLAARLDATVEALFAEATPETCPSDPIAKQRHLKALALARLILDDSGGVRAGARGGRAGRAEFVVVIDTTGDPTGASPGTAGGSRVGSPAGAPAADDATAGAGAGAAPAGWEYAWPIPVEIPASVIAQMLRDDEADLHAVVVRNGIVLHAPGELNLGRTTRLANRAQRRALRGLYSTCGIPGCRVAYDQCKLHHIIWWRHGGATDLDNLLPTCSVHHAKIHHDGWHIELGPNRELTVTLPDGTIMTTGPPHRHAG